MFRTAKVYHTAKLKKKTITNMIMQILLKVFFVSVNHHDFNWIDFRDERTLSTEKVIILPSIIFIYTEHRLMIWKIFMRKQG